MDLSRIIRIFRLLLVFLIGTSGCKGRHDNGSEILAASGQGTVSVPPPSGTDNPLASDEVLAAMREARDRGMKSAGASDYKKYAESYVKACLGNDVPHWSDVVIHYYCQHGYLRMCFTEAARSGKTYPDSFDHCAAGAATTTQPWGKDWVWLTDSNYPARAQIFKYLMFTGQPPGAVQTFNKQDQHNVINEFYGVQDPESASDCSGRLKRNSNQENNPVCGKKDTRQPVAGGGSGGGAGGMDQVPIPQMDAVDDLRLSCKPNSYGYHFPTRAADGKSVGSGMKADVCQTVISSAKDGLICSSNSHSYFFVTKIKDGGTIGSGAAVNVCLDNIKSMNQGVVCVPNSHNYFFPTRISDKKSLGSGVAADICKTQIANINRGHICTSNSYNYFFLTEMASGRSIGRGTSLSECLTALRNVQ